MVPDGPVRVSPHTAEIKNIRLKDMFIKDQLDTYKMGYFSF